MGVGLGIGDRPAQHLALGCDLLVDAQADTLGTAVAVAGDDGPVAHHRRETIPDERHHPTAERHPEVDLRQAPVAAVLAHHPKVEGRRPHRRRGEDVAVDCGRGGVGREEGAAKQPVEVSDHRPRLAGLHARAHHPLGVEPVREELVRAGHHECGRPFGGIDRVERGVDRRHGVLVEAIVAVDQGEDEDVVDTVEGQQFSHFRTRLRPGSRRASPGPSRPGSPFHSWCHRRRSPRTRA